MAWGSYWNVGAPSAFLAGTGAAPAAPVQAAPAQNPYVTPEQQQANEDILNAYKEASGFKIKDLDERIRQFDAQMAWQEKQWEREGVPKLEIQRRMQDLAEQQFAFNSEMARANLGLDVTKFAATLGGPSDYFQYSDFVRGANQAGMPKFLQALASNTQMAGFNAPGAVGTTPQTMGGIMGDIAGGQRTGAGGAPGAPGGQPGGGGAFNFNPADYVRTDTGWRRKDDLRKEAFSTIGDDRFAAMQAAGQGNNPWRKSDNRGDYWRIGAGGGKQRISAQQYASGTYPGGPNAPQVGPPAQPPAIDPKLAAIGGILGRGAAALGPQQLESLSPEEIALLGSGAKKLGVSMPGWMQQYKMSRIGQSAGVSY